MLWKKSSTKSDPIQRQQLDFKDMVMLSIPTLSVIAPQGYPKYRSGYHVFPVFFS